MSSQHFDAERLRRHLHDLSSDVARRLIAVLDSARDGAHELSHEFNAVVCEITAIQRELVQELTGPKAAKTDLVTLARMLDLNKRAIALLEHLEALPAQPAFAHLGTGPSARSGAARSTAPPPGAAASQPRPRVPPGYDDANGYVPYDAWTEGAAAAPAPRVNLAHMAAQGRLARSFGAVPTSGVIAAALTVAFGLSATVGAHIFSGDADEAPRAERPTALRSDKLATPAPPSEARQSPPPPETPRPATQAAPVTETGALPPLTAHEQAPPDEDAELAFVAVLATQDDAEAAQAALTRLKESYPAILGPITAEVETVEGEGGRRWFRLTARPPVSREEADDLCRRLSEAGHTGCWVKPQPRRREAAFVAVLATRNDPTAALDEFRRLKARYPAILGTAEAQVEAVEVQGGATWHRLSTLPAVSREEARDLCTRLRKAGYATCWVKPRS